MSFIGDLFRGMMVLSIIAVAQEGCSVKNMTKRAVHAHKKTVSYGAYSRMLTGSNESWAKPEK